ncbi:hypothetical protein cyc_09088 [Cyclospora cayetanensis]|uniref:Uncharacterized protein n=1 Tax=Cyclospora cayetanensis TaxID=88456 RepID=A0A1D3DAM7_9EIME|nr:hypothetical protein cyc_09088 [Cyclospora cayetanensis]
MAKSKNHTNHNQAMPTAVSTLRGKWSLQGASGVGSHAPPLFRIALLLHVFELVCAVDAAEQKGPSQWDQEGSQEEKDLHQRSSSVVALVCVEASNTSCMCPKFLRNQRYCKKGMLKMNEE